MNGKMWEHPATRRNIEQLRKDGCIFLGPEQSGMLACDEGPGRLAPVDHIVEAVQNYNSGPSH